MLSQVDRTSVRRPGEQIARLAVASATIGAPGARLRPLPRRGVEVHDCRDSAGILPGLRRDYAGIFKSRQCPGMPRSNWRLTWGVLRRLLPCPADTLYGFAVHRECRPGRAGDNTKHKSKGRTRKEGDHKRREDHKRRVGWVVTSGAEVASRAAPPAVACSRARARSVLYGSRERRRRCRAREFTDGAGCVARVQHVAVRGMDHKRRGRGGHRGGLIRSHQTRDVVCELAWSPASSSPTETPHLISV